MKTLIRKGHELESKLLTEESDIFTFKIGYKEQNKINIRHQDGKLIINTDSYSDMMINMTAYNSFEIVFKDSI